MAAHNADTASQQQYQRGKLRGELLHRKWQSGPAHDAHTAEQHLRPCSQLPSRARCFTCVQPVRRECCSAWPQRWPQVLGCPPSTGRLLPGLQGAQQLVSCSRTRPSPWAAPPRCEATGKVLSALAPGAPHYLCTFSTGHRAGWCVFRACRSCCPLQGLHLQGVLQLPQAATSPLAVQVLDRQRRAVAPSSAAPAACQAAAGQG